MATSQSKSTGSTAAKKTASRSKPKALALLEKDHREVEGLFADFEKAKDESEKAELVQEICTTLKVHAQIEEELLYPMTLDEIGDEDLVNEALVEHHTAKQLIKEIEAAKSSDSLYDARVKVLGEYVKHHVREEEGEIFPALKKADVDLDELGDKLEARKTELMEKMTKSAKS